MNIRSSGTAIIMSVAALTVCGCESGSPTASSQTTDAAAPVADVADAAAPAADAAPVAHEWYAADVNFTACQTSGSPAERIQQIKQVGLQPVVNESSAPDGSLQVEVGEPLDGLRTQYVVFYRSRTGCEMALAAKNSVPANYQ